MRTSPWRATGSSRSARPRARRPRTTSPGSLAAIRHALDTFDEERARALARQFAEDGTWNCPTLIRIKTQELCASPGFPADPDLRFMSPGTLRTWQKKADAFRGTFTAEQHDTSRPSGRHS